jgi:hypothetical protein
MHPIESISEDKARRQIDQKQHYLGTGKGSFEGFILHIFQVWINKKSTNHDWPNNRIDDYNNIKDEQAFNLFSVRNSLHGGLNDKA